MGHRVGLCSSVIPYVTDQLAMARLPRATFALMLAILPATATVIGLVVLGQVPTVQDLVGIALVILGVALHQERRAFEAPGVRKRICHEAQLTSPGAASRRVG